MRSWRNCVKIDVSDGAMHAAARAQAANLPTLEIVPPKPPGLTIPVEALAAARRVWTARGADGMDPALARQLAEWAAWRREVGVAEAKNESRIHSVLISLRTLEHSPEAQPPLIEWLSARGIRTDGAPRVVARDAARRLDICPLGWRDPDAHASWR